MAQSREEIRAELEAALLSQKAELERSVSPAGGTMLTSTPFIIMVDNLAMNPEVVNSRVEAGPVRFGMPNRVRRFSKENAELLAPQITNGHGVIGRVVFWKDAVVARLKEIEQTLTFIQTAEN